MSNIKSENIDITIALKIISEFGKEVSYLTPFIYNIFQEKNEMWVRYQSLKTLVAIHSNPRNLLSFLKNVKLNDKQDLVKIEAAGLIQEIKQK